MVNQSEHPTVFVGMSGGVDSSVSAALLKQQGFNVVGVFMKNWSEEIDGITYCTAEQDFLDMRAVCQHLDIPYYTFNFEKEYKKRVLEYFFAEYKAGRTPNPDVMCNKEVKFDLFLKKCLSLGADFIATGHYARKRAVSSIKYQVSRTQEKINSSIRPDTGHLTPDTPYQLLKGVDKVKDQTYFLYNLTQEQLSKTLFPVGKYPKSQVRALAKKFKLPTATKKDSQGICFIGQVDVKEFLKTVIKTKSGKIVNQEGKVLGNHEGAWFYTIGQRRVAGLAGQTEPLYVIGTDIKKNLVIVGPDSATYGKAVILENLHLIGGESRIKNQESSNDNESFDHDSSFTIHNSSCLSAKPRYGPEVYSGRLIIEPASDDASSLSSRAQSRDLAPDSSITVGMTKGKDKKTFSRNSRLATRFSFVFDQPQRALTPGQSLVIYDGDVCLGGGIIKSVKK